MYKGKFDQKSKQETANVQDLLTQRQQAAEKEAAEARAAARKAAAAGKSPSAAKIPASGKTPSSAKAPASSKAPSTAKAPASGKAPSTAKAPASGKTAAQPKAVAYSEPPRRGPRLGGVIFYTLYFLFILIFFLATYIGLQWLNGWLVDYQAAQPTAKAEQVFTQLFSDPQWGDLYDASGVQDSAYEGKEEFVAYMEGHVDPSQLTYLETSAGLSGDRKYRVMMGSEVVATFTLVDQNKVDTSSLEDLGEIPDWQLGAVEVFFERENSYRIVNLDGHTAMVNGVALDDSHIIQIATTKAEEYLPEGTTGVSMCTQEITGLFTTPEVTIFDADGKQMEVTYDEATHTFTEKTESNTITAEENDVIVNAAKTYCLWMIKEVTDRGQIAKYFDPSSDAYSNIVKTTELWMQSHGGYVFNDVSVTDYTRYTDDIFSARISMTLSVTRTNGTVKDYPYAQSLFFHKTDSGSWLCFKATNADVTQPVGKVRLTFMQGDTQLYSNFFYTDAEEIVTPVISPVPEGKVFSGWVQRTTDENGQTVLQLVFQPDETGTVKIPEGTTLEPMTLYALFENAASGEATTEATTEAAETTGETTPQTTEGGA